MPIGTSTGERYEDSFSFTLGQTEEGFPFYQAQDNAPITSQNQSLTPEDTSLKSGQEIEGFTKLGTALTEGMVPDIAKRMVSDVIAAGTVFGRVGRGEVDLDSTEGFNEMMNAALTLGTLGMSTAFKRPGVGMFGGVGRFGKADQMLAEKMESAGMPTLQIKQATGLERGADNIWRREFSDIGLKVNKDAIGSSPQVMLDEVIQHDELFKRYPAAKDIEVVVDPALPNTRLAQFNPKENQIRFNPNFLDGKLKGEKIDTLDNVLLHEIQHWIQFKENFAFAPAFNKIPDNVSGPILDRLLRETEPAIYQKIEHLADNLQFEEAGKLQAKWFDEIKNSVYYSRLITEVESRNVQRRSKLSPDEIKNLVAKVTEDVPRPMQIYADYRNTKATQIGSIGTGDKLYGGQGPLKDFSEYEVRRAVMEMDPNNKLKPTDDQIRDYILEHILSEGPAANVPTIFRRPANDNINLQMPTDPKLEAKINAEWDAMVKKGQQPELKVVPKSDSIFKDDLGNSISMEDYIKLGKEKGFVGDDTTIFRNPANDKGTDLRPVTKAIEDYKKAIENAFTKEIKAINEKFPEKVEDIVKKFEQDKKDALAAIPPPNSYEGALRKKHLTDDYYPVRPFKEFRHMTRKEWNSWFKQVNKPENFSADKDLSKKLDAAMNEFYALNTDKYTDDGFISKTKAMASKLIDQIKMKLYAGKLELVPKDDK